MQVDLNWEEASKNRELFDSLTEGLQGRADLVILPEMFTTGFTMNSARLAEPMSGETIRWMREKAVRLGAVITGSLIINENGRYYNRLIWMPPDGSVEWYDKRHLFRMGAEDRFYSAGKNRLVTRLKGWRISPLICYDLRFPVWSRNCNDTDVLIYVANWPASRRTVWNVLLKARAIENQVFVAGVNRVGTDGEGIKYLGETRMINPKGEVIAGLDSGFPGITIATLSPEDLTTFREKFPVALDADNFTIQP